VDDTVEHRVSCGVLVRAGRVLLVQRSASKLWFPGVWDFPGGHLEPGEDSRRTLVRELREELGVDIPTPSGTPLLTIRSADAHMDFWRVVDWQGVVVNAAPDEHDALRWFAPDDAAHLDLADGRYPALIRRAVVGEL
jgi:8-oxo-dGTP diphosphatase